MTVKVQPAGPSVSASNVETGRRSTSLPDIGLKKLSLFPFGLIRRRCMLDARRPRNRFHGGTTFPLALGQAPLRRIRATGERLGVLL